MTEFYWRCAYCVASFLCRANWVVHLQLEHDIEEDNIVEHWDREEAEQ